MLVYGDHEERAGPRRLTAEINARLDAVAAMPAGIGRHAALVAALIDAGQLQQGIADHLFAEARKCDRKHPLVEDLGAALLQLGRAVCRSWDSGFTEVGALPRFDVGNGAPDEVTIRVPEGFAFYALYPEAYADAARRLDLAAPPRVIGLRSIGTSLAAVVAAALGAPPPVSVRPFGHPAEREIDIDECLARELLDGEAHYVIVDEGPGQSGSSFAAVARWLRERGVSDERVALLPSHAGSPGAAATDERRRWWRSTQRQVADHGDRLGELAGEWAASLVGPLDGPAREITGGGPWERRKFLVAANGERFLIKFAGLGAIGEAKLAIARALHVDRLNAEPVGLVHGFLIERCCEGAPLARGEKPIGEIARYIGTRARLLPAMRESGASIELLLTMVRRNLSLEFGDRFEAATDRFEPAELERRVVRVCTDNKLQPHEWLRTPDGRLLKVDALDHHRAHDLIGCQDFAWDVAGAIVEFGLSESEAARLIEAAEEQAFRSVDSQLLDFYRLAYLAFRVGQARLASAMVSSGVEQERMDAAGDRYAAELQLLLERSKAATRPNSSVG
ncbi:MAG TPA: hypothetical protein VIL42_06815 [Sphingomicrobium sp.]